MKERFFKTEKAVKAASLKELEKLKIELEARSQLFAQTMGLVNSSKFYQIG